jgi:Dyp-type peroxidase family
VLSLFAQSPATLEATTTRLERAWGPACVELGRHDGEWQPDGVGHFGYRDGISQPVIESIADGLPDDQPRVPPGAFLLGYPSQHENFTYPVPAPAALGHNGSFAALRVLAQDVDGFAEFLAERAADTGLSTELLAAKLCGRWRNGVPLALSPDTDTPDPPLPPEALNDFDFVGEVDDRQGLRCPVGSHIRRMFPRGQPVAGDGASQHRIIRRGIPYGPAYDPTQPRDGIDRGLLGLFIGVSLRDQFEFVMANWANSGTFTAGLGRTQDPLVGGHDSKANSMFVIPRPDGPVALDGMARFVTTRGGLYCFLPSRTALRYLATLSDG